MSEPQIALCPKCGHPCVEHSKVCGCEHEPFCWCHLADPQALAAELAEYRPEDERRDDER